MSLISSSAVCKAAPALACSKIVSLEGFKAWWIGKVNIESVDPTWPALGSKMSWKAGGGIFKAEITTDARPLYIEMLVVTPGADSTIRQSFEELPGGGTRYTKTIDPKMRTILSRILSPLYILMLRALNKREVKKAAAFADAK